MHPDGYASNNDNMFVIEGDERGEETMALSFKGIHFPKDVILLLAALRVGYGGRANRHGRVTTVLRPALHREHKGSSWSEFFPCRRPGMFPFLLWLTARCSLLFLPGLHDTPPMKS